MHDPQAPLRAEVRRLYVDGLETVDEIAARFGVTSRTIHEWARRDGWPRRRLSRGGRRSRTRTPDRTLAICAAEPPEQRLRRLFNRFLQSLEERMTSDSDHLDPPGDRDIRALGEFARALEKIKEIEPGNGRSDRGGKTSGRVPGQDAAEEDRLRRELVDRLLRLRERKRLEG